MYRFTHVLIIVCIVTVGSSSVWAESDESEAAAEKTRIPGWFRVDTDTLGTHFLIGATHSVGGISLDSNIYINDTIGEFDLGVSIPAVKGDSFSLVVGPRINIGYGENNTLGILVGYDTKKAEEQTGLTGRLSFTRTW